MTGRRAPAAAAPHRTAAPARRVMRPARAARNAWSGGRSVLEDAEVTPEQRLEAFRKMVEARPDEPFARYSLAMAYRSLGRDEEAAREFEALARARPDYVPTYLMMGQALEAVGRADDAALCYERGIGAATRARADHARSELQQALDVLRARGV
jgi:tetratricopeptide (TPR) repeat protein